MVQTTFKTNKGKVIDFSLVDFITISTYPIPAEKRVVDRAVVVENGREVPLFDREVATFQRAYSTWQYSRHGQITMNLKEKGEL